MDLDWCLICEQKTQGTLYCSEECRFKDCLSAYSSLTPPASPTSSSGSSTPTDSSNASIVSNKSFVYPFYRKPSPYYQRSPMIINIDNLRNNTTICVLPPPPAIKKSLSALNSTIDMASNTHV
ncbi:7044_t:CDS:2 [Funneliformis geosporum]|nr:7044_t:CDS:2 [Funneliformis geosporum]